MYYNNKMHLLCNIKAIRENILKVAESSDIDLYCLTIAHFDDAIKLCLNSLPHVHKEDEH